MLEVQFWKADVAKYERYMQSLQRKYCGAGTRDGLNHQVLKRKGGLDLAMSGLDLDGPFVKMWDGRYPLLRHARPSLSRWLSPIEFVT